MSTSILDYIFRELGIAYLHREDLAHVKPSAIQDKFAGDATADAFHWGVGNNGSDQDGDKPAPAVETQPEPEVDHVAKARKKGYMGDPCGECGNFTLVRNGTCLKCETCGATSGCS